MATQNQTPAAGSDPYGFIALLNAYRAAAGLAPVVHDGALDSFAAANNAAQAARNQVGHFVKGPGWQNAAVGAYSVSAVMASWQASPAHNSTLLQPSITAVGVHHDGAGHWTMDAR